MTTKTSRTRWEGKASFHDSDEELPHGIDEPSTPIKPRPRPPNAAEAAAGAVLAGPPTHSHTSSAASVVSLDMEPPQQSTWRRGIAIANASTKAANAIREMTQLCDQVDPDLPWRAGSLKFGSLLLSSLFLKIGF